MSEVSKNSAFIFRLSSPDPFNCVLYTDGGAYYTITTTSDEANAYATLTTDLPTPPMSPVSPTASRKELFAGRLTAERVGEVVTVRSARGLGEFVGSVRHAKGGWEIAMGLEEERGTTFGKFFGLGMLGKVMGNKPKIRDPSGGFWTWQGYRSEKDLFLLSPTNEIAAQFRPADSERMTDPNAALIVYQCAFEVKELVLVSWLALERVGREEAREKKEGKGRKGSRKSGEWRSMSLGGVGK